MGCTSARPLLLLLCSETVVCSLRQILCLNLQVLDQHAFNSCRSEILFADTEIADMNVTSEFRVGVIVVIEIPGGGIAARPLTVGRNLASARGIDGIDLQQEITAAVDIEVDRLQPVTKRSEEQTSELQSRPHLVCRLLL